MRKRLLLLVVLQMMGVALAVPIRSNLAAKGIATPTIDSGLSAKDYIQDGLVAMWDGIENAGYGKHNASATIWKDLVGDNDITLLAPYQTITPNSIIFTRSGVMGGALSYLISDLHAIEFCGSVSSGNETALFANDYTTSDRNVYSCIWYYQGTLGAGFQKYGYLVSLNTSVTIYADYDNGTNISSFSVKCLNGEEKEPDGVKDWFRSSNQLGFGFRTYCYSGTCYCLRIYNRALTADEITHNYAIDKERFGL